MFFFYVFSTEVEEIEEKKKKSVYEKKIKRNKALFANGQKYLSELPGNTIIVCPYVPVCIRTLSLL